METEEKNYYFTTPFKDEYLLTLGRAMAVFSTLGWNVVYLIFYLDDQKWIRNIQKKTAGQIAQVLFSAIDKTKLVLPEEIKGQLNKVAEDFDKSVLLRNSLFHGNPATSPTTKKPTLMAKEYEWTIDKISETTIIFQEISLDANKLIHKYFKNL